LKGNTISYSFVHSAVAAAFIGPRPQKHDVNHKNGNRSDNRACNLEYMTRKDNLKHMKEVLGHRNGRKRTLTLDQVQAALLDCHNGMRQRDAAKKYGVTQAAISSMVRGCHWSNRFLNRDGSHK
jgi:hypothetical protein